MSAVSTDVIRGKPLAEQLQKRSIGESQWITLSKNLFPGAKAESVLMVIDYCIARKLDPLKKPCHIVPMKVRKSSGDGYEYRDVVMPGIYEYRTTAHRTKEYAGHSRPEYGPMVEAYNVTAPEFCDFTVYREKEGFRSEFPVRAYFREVVALKDGKANDRWHKAPIQMLTKCAEAAALREAFPDEFGGEMTVEEMEGKTIAEDPSRDIPGQPERPVYSETEFKEKLEKWRELVTGGHQSAEEIITIVESKVSLSEEQKAAIRALAAPQGETA